MKYVLPTPKQILWEIACADDKLQKTLLRNNQAAARLAYWVKALKDTYPEYHDELMVSGVSFQRAVDKAPTSTEPKQD
jgi:hypothetical protein